MASLVAAAAAAAAAAWQSLPPGGHLVSLDKDISWVLVAKRFLWQASQGEANKARPVPLGDQVRHPCKLERVPCCACLHECAHYRGSCQAWTHQEHRSRAWLKLSTQQDVAFVWHLHGLASV
jgi:hypothetical protein